MQPLLVALRVTIGVHFPPYRSKRSKGKEAEGLMALADSQRKKSLLLFDCPRSALYSNQSLRSNTLH